MRGVLHLHHSNRLDALADALLDRWPGPRAANGIPAPEVVIVPSRAIERWLTWRIADRNGVCANVRFEFAAAFLWRTFAGVLPGVAERSPFDSEVTTLRLFEHFGDLPRSAGLEPLAAYVEGGDGRKRLELARRIARVFADYMLYRPDWLERWAEGRLVGLPAKATERWQQQLWQWLVQRAGAEGLRHPAAEFFAALERDPAARARLPACIRVFGLPALPPLYLDILARLGRHVTVEWYALNPCRQFWADIVSQRTLVRDLLAGDPASQYADVGHPLLASWGSQARLQHALLSAHGGEAGVEEHDAFRTPQGHSLLQRLQASIVELAPLPAAAVSIDSPDRSIRLHACHSLTRQVEVLHDQLLDLFDQLPGLQPPDIAVFAPDLEALAPVVDAVFGAAAEGRHIPYTITGRAARQGGVLGAVQFLLALPQSRFEAAAVLGFLEIPAVARRYRLTAADLERIRTWLAEAGVRWGLDAAHRDRAGVPGTERHTWLETLYRLLVGYAMPAGTGELVHGVLPYAELEGSHAQTLARLLEALSNLVRAAQALGRRHALADWSAVLQRHVLDQVEPLSEDIADHERVRGALADLAHDARAAGSGEAVGIDVVRVLLQSRLEAGAPGAVPSGVVTFAPIGPLRGIPFRVIGLLGLDDGAFPRSPARAEFDLVRDNPRHGDRSPREDDRGAFLDALLAARDAVLIAWNGRSILDNAKLQPSVLVSEVLDELQRVTAADSGPLVTEHPLQPFDCGYFEAGAPRSYASELLDAARALRSPPHERLQARPLFTRPLGPPPEEMRRVELQELIRFYRNPCSALLRRRLGVRLLAPEEEISADEPFVLASESLWNLRDELLAQQMAGRPAQECLDYALASPHTPAGPWGREGVGPILEANERFIARVRAASGGTVLEPYPFDIEIGPYELHGTLASLDREGLLFHEPRNEGVHVLLPAWIQHAVLCAVRPRGAGCRTRGITSTGGYAFGALADPQAILETLLDHYWRGLSSPLPFFPRSSFAYVSTEGGMGLKEALTLYRGNEYEGKEGERDKPAYRAVFGGRPDQLPEGFERCAQAILGPLVAARTDLAGSAP